MSPPVAIVFVGGWWQLIGLTASVVCVAASLISTVRAEAAHRRMLRETATMQELTEKLRSAWAQVPGLPPLDE